MQRQSSATDTDVMNIDWKRVAAELDGRGNAVVEGLLKPEECRAVGALYSQDAGFRSRVVMSRHGFGRGEYKYFAYPLPPIVARLRSTLYPPLAKLANRWNGALGN